MCVCVCVSTAAIIDQLYSGNFYPHISDVSMKHCTRPDASHTQHSHISKPKYLFTHNATIGPLLGSLSFLFSFLGTCVPYGCLLLHRLSFVAFQNCTRLCR